MTHQEYPNVSDNLMELIIQHGPEAMGQAFASLLNSAMAIERQQTLTAAPYERTDQRRGYANGYKPKTIRTRAGELTVQVPQTRDYADENGNPFYPTALERGIRSERALTLAVAEMYVQGVSTRKVTKVVQELCGLQVTSTQVSRAAAELDKELEAWRNRPIGEIPYLILDATYEKVRYAGSVISCALLTAIGVTPDGKRTILGTSVLLSEAESHWRTFLESLQKRGMHGVRMITSDDHAGMRAARQAFFPSVPWQRCQFHLIQNAMAHVPKQNMKSQVASDLSNIFNAPNRLEAEQKLKETAEKYQQIAPELSAWMQDNIPEGLSVFTLPQKHQRRLRTSNCLERLHKEINRRTRVATLFPNTASLLRLASAVLSEISEGWEVGKTYLNMTTQ